MYDLVAGTGKTGTGNKLENSQLGDTSLKQAH